MEYTNVIDKIYTWLKYGCYQQSLHYHNTPQSHERLYKKQLEYVNEHYEIWTPKQVLLYLEKGTRKKKPSIVIGAFDGYRNHYEVLFRLLEEEKMHGWFLLVTDFIDSPQKEQENVLSTYRMQWVPEEYEDGRYAMTWEEATLIARNHTIINHTATHYLLAKDSPEDELQYEILHAQKRIEDHLGIKPEIFSWLGGLGMEKSSQAAKILRDNDYHFLIGYRMEYVEKNITEKNKWEMAVADGSSRQELAREVRYYEQLISNIGWYSGIPAILPLYREGQLITDGSSLKDIELAEHFAAIARYLTTERGMDLEIAGNRALEVLAVCRIGEGFPFY